MRGRLYGSSAGVGPMSRRGLLAGLSAVAGLGLLPGGPARAARKGKLLVWWSGGGWDPTYAFDLHPESDLAQDPASEVRSAGDLRWVSSPRRPAVDAFFELHGPRAVILNGVAVGSISHGTCTVLSLTGTRSRDRADLTAQVGAAAGAELALPTLSLGGPSFPGEHGAVVTPISGLMSGTLAGRLPRAAPAVSADEARVQAFLRAEGDALRGRRGQAWRAGLDRLAALGPAADLLAMPDAPTHEDRASVALQALSSGLTRAALLPAPLPERGTWDTHFQNDMQQSEAFETSFDALNTLLAQMAEMPGVDGSLLDETVVLLMSEMGRAPVLNPALGKDHWPTTSWVVMGSGVAGGRVLGHTSSALAARPVDPATGLPDDGGELLSPAHVLAGIAAGFGVDAAAAWPGVRPLLGLWG